ncbi:polyprenyl synthetase family protein [Pajaroellobacter abortibovis]|uniref:polyprenyl synthetase family protein n=1 Tax=Pajaroellobacter abortibovis TaxID=1882918 RepID=UPI0015618950|nr:polyprenyl synthetase family protein [Pajaroellobacter abortibovis]
MFLLSKDLHESTLRRDRFLAYWKEMQIAVEAQLESCLERCERHMGHLHPFLGLVAQQFRSLTMRGGKRLRSILLCSAYEACGGEDGEEVIQAAVAFELLQSYLLIHDDWMDDDLMRRGGPTVHASFAEHYQSKDVGAAVAILAGDLASAMAQKELFSLPLPEERVLKAARHFALLQKEVIWGQLLDICPFEEEVPWHTFLDLKTGSYTVRGPIAMGCILAEGTQEQQKTLEAFARPLGIAFQIRDDLLGVFGDSEATGKPIWNDIRKGKQTFLMAEASRHEKVRALLPQVYGRGDWTPQEMSSLLTAIEEAGVRDVMEARLRSFLEEALQALLLCPISKRGAELLEGAAYQMIYRDR